MSALLGLGASAALLLSAAPGPAQNPVPVAELHTILHADDYPMEAIRKGEQGTVAFRLDVGADGRVTGCSVVASSGSAILDAATCRIMAERATFHPATGEDGKAVPGSMNSRISWKMEESNDTIPPGAIMLPPEASAAINAWFRCAVDEATGVERPDLSPEQRVDAAFARCTDKQADARAQLVEAKLPDADLDQVIAAIRQKLREQALSSLDERAKGQGVERPD